MEANTLRLENYVEYNSMFFKVKLISKSGVSCDRGKGIVELSIKDINPIPLSEDILLKLGFEKSNAKISGCDYFTKDKYSVMVKEDVCYFSLVEMQSRYLCIVEFLHQIQNVYFALTNEELTIKE